MKKKKKGQSSSILECSLELPDLSDLTEQLERSLLAVGVSVPDLVQKKEEGQEEESGKQSDCPWFQDFADWSGVMYKVLDWKSTEKGYSNRVARAGPQEANRLKALMDLLRARGEYRKLSTIVHDWRNRLDDMERMFPNFGAVIDYVRGTYALAEIGDKVPRLSPILLNGPPGVGKTYFARYFAEHFGSGFFPVHMENAQTNSGLSGSAEYWANTKAGEVFAALIEYDFANPVFCLDEIDKAREGEHDPTTSLYSLLEPETASMFTDLSYPWLKIDASKVVWLCTSNEAEILPSPLLDRFRTFNINMPTQRQAREIVLFLFERLVTELSQETRNIRLASNAVDTLSTFSPRRMQQALLEGMGRALYEKRKYILQRDIVLGREETTEVRKMGFIP